VRTSLITVTYNSARVLERFWAGHFFPADVEWIVVDNASSDGSAETARRLGAHVVALDENRGFSAANNIGLSESHGEFIGFVNPDIALDVATLGELERTARDCDAVVAPQLLNDDGSPQPNGRGFPLLTSKIRNRIGREDPRYLLYADSAPRRVCWLMGAAVFATRPVLERFGAWDPHFFVYYEDTDLCLRAWRAGVPVLVDPRVQWKHGWARETKSLNLRAWRLELASMARFYARYPEFLRGRAASRRAHPQIDSAVFGVPAS
jgi:N-acetylglucosaminyl-diphospho-decaprenol L-rhamnosyltransferase